MLPAIWNKQREKLKRKLGLASDILFLGFQVVMLPSEVLYITLTLLFEMRDGV